MVILASAPDLVQNPPFVPHDCPDGPPCPVCDGSGWEPTEDTRSFLERLDDIDPAEMDRIDAARFDDERGIGG